MVFRSSSVLALAVCFAGEAAAFAPSLPTTHAAGRSSTSSVTSLRCAGDAGETSRRTFLSSASTAAAAIGLSHPTGANAASAGPKLPDEFWNEKVRGVSSACRDDASRWFCGGNMAWRRQAGSISPVVISFLALLQHHPFIILFVIASGWKGNPVLAATIFLITISRERLMRACLLACVLARERERERASARGSVGFACRPQVKSGQLSGRAYQVLHNADTERPNTSPLLKENREGIFSCAA